ncbi:hypothetical protein GCM10027280_25080 [Micromonospora polyrhachis]
MGTVTSVMTFERIGQLRVFNRTSPEGYGGSDTEPERSAGSDLSRESRAYALGRIRNRKRKHYQTPSSISGQIGRCPDSSARTTPFGGQIRRGVPRTMTARGTP